VWPARKVDNLTASTSNIPTGELLLACRRSSHVGVDYMLQDREQFRVLCRLHTVQLCARKGACIFQTGNLSDISKARFSVGSNQPQHVP
jgi:hypothetical protein